MVLLPYKFASPSNGSHPWPSAVYFAVAIRAGPLGARRIYCQESEDSPASCVRDCGAFTGSQKRNWTSGLASSLYRSSRLQGLGSQDLAGGAVLITSKELMLRVG
jgi:hypothetical protein